MLMREISMLHSPTGGASCSHRTATPETIASADYRQRRRYCRHSRVVPFAQSDPRTERSGRGPATEYYDDRQQRRSQYDYPPSSGRSSQYQQQEAYRPPDTAGRNGGGGPGGGGNSGGPNGGGDFSKALLAGAFVLGIGVGVWFNSEANFAPSSVASTELIDRKTPNTEVCMANGYSSMVFDQRLFVSFNPFNVFVAQPEIKPGCVLRRSNINVLENKKLVSGNEVNQCVRNSNTFAFVGDLDKSPEVSCVYHSEDAENQFVRNPKRAAMGDGVQPHELLPVPGAQKGAAE